MGAHRVGALARRLESLLIPLVVVIGALGVAVPGPGRTVDGTVAIDLTLAVLVFTAGLAIEVITDIAAVRARSARLVVVIAVSTATLPLLAWLLGHLVSTGYRGGILAVGVAPSEVAAVGLVGMAGGEVAVAASLLVASSIVTVLVAGPILEALADVPTLHPLGLLLTLTIVVAIPLAAGAGLRRLLDGKGQLLDAARLVGLVALLVLLWQVDSRVQLRLSYLGVAAVLLGLLAGSSVLGWLLARALPQAARSAVLLPVAMRDFAVAAGIAASAFGPGATGPLGIYGLLVLVFGAAAARLASSSRPKCAGRRALWRGQ